MTATRKVLASVVGRRTESRPLGEVWWLLLDCGCTIWRSYRPESFNRASCSHHTDLAITPPKVRGKGVDQVWMRELCGCGAPPHGQCDMKVKSS